MQLGNSVKFNYYKSDNPDQEAVNVDGDIEDVKKDIAMRNSISIQSLGFTENLAIAQLYEDVWNIGLRRWSRLIDDPGVEEPYKNELDALPIGFIYKEEDTSTSEQNS